MTDITTPESKPIPLTITVKETIAMIGISQAWFNKVIVKDPKFPKRIYLGSRNYVFIRSEIIEWLESLKDQRLRHAAPHAATTAD